MRPSTTVPAPLPTSRKAPQHYSSLLCSARWRALGLTAMLVVSAAAAPASPTVESPRETVLKLVAQIQKADYQGDRAALQHLYADLQPFAADEKLASRVRYWRGFALWRRPVNGFNESADPKDIDHDLTPAIAEFKESTAAAPPFVAAKLATPSSPAHPAY